MSGETTIEAGREFAINRRDEATKFAKIECDLLRNADGTLIELSNWGRWSYLIIKSRYGGDKHLFPGSIPDLDKQLEEFWRQNRITESDCAMDFCQGIREALAKTAS